MKLDKSYIATNWMKILRILGYVTLALIAILKLSAPKTVIPDFIKYGKEIKPGETTGMVKGLFGTLFNTAYTSLYELSPQLPPLVAILTIAILSIVTLHMIIDKKPDKKKK